MKKLIVGFAVAMIFIMTIGVYAETSLSSQEKEEITNVVKEVSKSEGISDAVQKYVEEFVEKKGIGAEKINNISEVDIKTLPEDVNIENAENANIAIYNIDYNETENQNKQLFVVTYSSEKMESQGDLVVSGDVRQFLNFGSENEISDGFLKTATGVVGSLKSGYVMMRAGGITGISTNLDVVNPGKEVEIIIYKNGEPIRFGNTIEASSVGIKKDYDIQSKNVVTFEPGDVISAYVSSDDGISVKSVITMVEITTR